ncbi:uncharacterized protein LOC111073296 [Drosophila obscura]|uniref:uncharacterized protein LOC111073296 n=1 Tax=Drosophila obscura TaxID=7282 RepID=UPI001BB16AEB|nr:uncharacterized protein LOC111073296 [Drosophila obscura]
MSAWSDHQHLARAVIICCFLLPLLLPSITNAAAHERRALPKEKMQRQDSATWRRMLEDGRRLHTQLLYDAYRDRLRNTDSEAVAEPLNQEKIPAAHSPIEYAAMEEHSVESGRGLDRLSKEEREGSAAGKRPPISGMLILKMNNENSAINATARATHKQEPEAAEGDQRQCKPTGMYRESGATKLSNEQPAKSLRDTLIKSGSFGLSALTGLMDVLDRLEQGDMVSELAKRISEGMEPQLSSNSSSSLLGGRVNLASDELLDNVDPQRAATNFKHILKDLKKRRPSDQLGGLYDDYLQIFTQALSDQKCPRASPRRSNGLKMSQCRAKPASLAADRAQGQTKKNIKSKVLAPETDYMKALDTFLKMGKENQLNGGLKPYYLPTSKNRQLIWNEVPLIKPGLSPEPAHKLKAESSKKMRLHSDKKRLKLLASDEHGSKVKMKTPPAPAVEGCASALDPNQIINGLKAIKQTPFYNLYDEYQRQMQSLKQSLQCKQDWWREVMDKGAAFARALSKRDVPNNLYPLIARGAPVPFPEALMNQATGMGQSVPQIGGNMMDNMASQMNMSPLELAQRLVGTNVRPATASGAAPSAIASVGRMPSGFGPVQGQLGNQIGSGQVVSLPLNTFRKSSQLVPQQQKPPQEMVIQDPPTQESLPQDQPTLEPAKNVSMPKQEPPKQEPSKQEPLGKDKDKDPSNIAPVLDKILQRLETMQENKCNNATSADEKELQELPCCFADPADGAPCDINGSWESLVLGVRINIRTPKKDRLREGEKKASCYNPKGDKSRRQCVKINQSQLKDKSDAKKDELLHTGLTLNISVQETVPPRAHVLIENLTDWDFSGHALGVLGGPVSLAFRKVKSNLVGNFVGYCRTCGCVDTIFGSWTFCQPSRDCQDITMSIVDRRDLLRRYSLDEKRKNRYKEQLYLGSKFARVEKERMEAELMRFEKSTPQPQLQLQLQQNEAAAPRYW